jgi:hypothetical protein
MKTVGLAGLIGAIAIASACGGSVKPSSAAGDDGGGGGVDAGGAGDDAATAGDDAALDAPVATGPISAPSETWTWVPFSDSSCMNNTPTGIGVNMTTRSDKLAIFLMGGGACWDAITVSAGVCVNMAGYGSANAASDFSKYGSAGMFKRDDPDNPFKDYSYVYVPYCTGDVHAGDNPSATDGVQSHLGYRNVAAFLKRIVPTWPHPSQVALTGSSAGGMGVLMNLPQVADAFGPTVPMVALDDAAIIMSPTYLKPGLQTATDGSWKYSQHFPADCPSLQIGALHEVYACLAQKYPGIRLGLYGTQGDSTMRSFFGYGYNPPGQMPAADYQAGLTDVSANVIAPFSEMHNYWAPGTSHTFLGQTPLGKTVVNNVKITDWIRGLLDGTAAFTDVAP